MPLPHNVFIVRERAPMTTSSITCGTCGRNRANGCDCDIRSMVRTNDPLHKLWNPLVARIQHPIDSEEFENIQTEIGAVMCALRTRLINRSIDGLLYRNIDRDSKVLLGRARLKHASSGRTRNEVDKILSEAEILSFIPDKRTR